jgi:hypothetical protein
VTQVQSLIQKVDWTSATFSALRSLVRKFLRLADVSAKLDVDPSIFDQKSIPYSILLRVCATEGKETLVKMLDVRVFHVHFRLPQLGTSTPSSPR